MKYTKEERELATELIDNGFNYVTRDGCPEYSLFAHADMPYKNDRNSLVKVWDSDKKQKEINKELFQDVNYGDSRPLPLRDVVVDEKMILDTYLGMVQALRDRKEVENKGQHGSDEWHRLCNLYHHKRTKLKKWCTMEEVEEYTRKAFSEI